MRKLFFTIVVLLTAGLLAASPLPDYEGLVTDRAGVLSRSDIQQLESKANAYRSRTGSEIGVLIVPTIGDQSIEDYARDIFKTWGVGKKDKDNGVLFLVAIQEKKARVEVGYGLEGELTDIESGRLV
ncbi:MAG: TPM domain-containing protein, partial [candidate division Zixibacteria bacterium]|nr:TPM domain-containing protein [candidate division Zixibacteria bacterium]